jgi:glycerol-3-phosphate dehydrogenase subunit B
MTAARQPQVVVLGGGAAGTAAALAAAHHGAAVTLVNAAPGATALSSGAVDLASRHVGSLSAPGTMDQALHRFFDAQGQHPLSRLGATAVMAAGAQANQWLAGDEELYPLRGWDEGPWWGVTPWGGLHPTWLGQAPQLDVARQRGRIGVVDVGPDSVLPAWLACGQLEALAHQWKLDVSFVPVTLAMPPGLASRRPLAVAQQLEGDERAVAELGRALGEAQRGQSVDALLAPPWSGTTGGLALWRRLSDMAQVQLFETLGCPGDPSGLRLSRCLARAARRGGVDLVQGRAESLLVESNRVVGIVVSGHDEPIMAEACVLATGGLAGGGLEYDGTLALGLDRALPVGLGGHHWQRRTDRGGGDASPLLGQAVTAPHPLLAAGILIDDRLRPLGPDGPLWTNVRVAGGVLADHDPVADGCGLATALITGFCAGHGVAGRDDGEIKSLLAQALDEVGKGGVTKA